MYIVQQPTTAWCLFTAQLRNVQEELELQKIVKGGVSGGGNTTQEELQREAAKNRGRPRACDILLQNSLNMNTFKNSRIQIMGASS